MTKQEKTIPDGYFINAQGHLVPAEMIKPIDKERDALVKEIFQQAEALNKSLSGFKHSVFGDVAAFIQMSAEQYGAKIGGDKGNVTLFSFDGRLKLQVATQDSIAFDERLQAAKALVDECINEWSAGSDPKIKVLVQQAFQTDKEGKVNVGRILALRRLEIDDLRWQNAMKAVGESIQVVSSKQYVRVYQRVGDTDQYEAINLNIAAV